MSKTKPEGETEVKTRVRKTINVVTKFAEHLGEAEAKQVMSVLKEHYNGTTEGLSTFEKELVDEIKKHL